LPPARCILSLYPNAAKLRQADDPANLPGMRRPRPANDNNPNSPSLQRYAWDVYRAAARARWIGRVIAPNADAAVEAAAIEFNTGVRKLIAVRRFEIE
jgi:hypothetical protein